MVYEQARRLIAMALAEDVGLRGEGRPDVRQGDLTSRLTVPRGTRAVGRIVAKEPLVVCGLPIAAAVFAAVDRRVAGRARARDGQAVKAGAVVAEVRGPAASILTAERTALNFLQRLSGIATGARRFVEAARPHPVRILDTRKTTPGWRHLEKYAVRIGGASNHRLGLHDAVLIKDNHIAAAGGVAEAIRRARAGGGRPIEVEVQSEDELEEALAFRPERILLDNFELGGLRRMVRIARAKAGRSVRLEASGGITLDRIAALAATGVDDLSVGALTHSARAANLSLDLRLESGPGRRGR